jgi:hypothetical protein
MEDNIAKWYFIAMAVMIVFIMAGQTISEWNKTDCRLKLGQAGRNLLDVNEICK